MIKLEICSVDLSYPSIVQIFVKKTKTHRRRIISFNPDKLQLKILMTIFGVKNPQKMEGKIFQIAEEFSQTDLAFEHLINQGHL
jgi:hypothetical protein